MIDPRGAMGIISDGHSAIPQSAVMSSDYPFEQRVTTLWPIVKNLLIAGMLFFADAVTEST